MTRKTVLFFCCLAAIMVGPAWGEDKQLYIYKCPAGQYAVGSELTPTEDKCQAGFSNSTKVVYPVPSNGVVCKPCPNVYFAKPKVGDTHVSGDDCIVIGRKCTPRPKLGPLCMNICLTGTTNRNRYRPAVQKNCYLQGGSREYEDEMGYFTLSGNCYYTGE